MIMVKKINKALDIQVKLLTEDKTSTFIYIIGGSLPQDFVGASLTKLWPIP